MTKNDWPVNLLAAASALVAAPAWAHPEYAPAVVSHYVKLDLVAPDRVRLAYTILVGPEPALPLRQAFDANHDGKLDATETAALGDKARAAVVAGLQLATDGQPRPLTFETPLVGLAGDAVAAQPFSIDLVALVPLAGAPPHTLRVDDQVPEPRLGETEVRIEESPATALLGAHRGTGDDEKQAAFLFRGPRFSALEDRSVTVRFGARAPQSPPAKRPAPSSPSWRARAAGLAAFTALAALLLWSSVRRRK